MIMVQLQLSGEVSLVIKLLLLPQDRLEEELTKREVEVLELTATLEALKKNNKDEKRRRAQQAFKVSGP